MNVNALRDIFRVNLGVKKNERVLVFTDLPSEKETIPSEDIQRRERLRCVSLLAAELGRGFSKDVIYYEYASLGSHGIEPPEGLWERAFGKKTVSELKKVRLFTKILKKEIDTENLELAGNIISKNKRQAVDAVVALPNYSTTHTTFRDFLTRLCGTRYASMPLFDVSMLDGAMSVDYRQLAKKTNQVAALLNKAVFIEISTPNGTKISFSNKGRKAKADTGMLTRPGAGGNLPAGEAFLAPVEGTAEGKLVLQWAPTRKLTSPVILTIKKGLVADVGGKDPLVSVLKSKISDRAENANVAELGIGTNNMAKRPDNILESEKILGTIHIALGDNSTFGGTVKTPFHQDFVFFRPTVALTGRDGKKTLLMKEGKPILGRE